VPAGGAEQADRGKGKRYGVHLMRQDACGPQAVASRFDGHAILRVLFSHEPFFFGRSDYFAIDEERCRRVVAEGTGEAENDHVVPSLAERRVL
jgi:hypothetical protein